ncbi:Rcr1p SCDLUD_002531 [Saccharomycodes ludwigii]|uniref:Rcr1p n=1 Tax=Saccharomycodes ludwigii TaxID=36035 RepID=UPI001E8ACD05|nr:hypothetical protein SCDLUD_002531 [Saccharomycodes ludwigii]KAH3901057.1 hypothetical protein SCDLUD_002531 [Saccharomycodes ludwigii]
MHLDAYVEPVKTVGLLLKRQSPSPSSSDFWDDGDGDGDYMNSHWEWARWIFFVLFVVAVIFIILGTIRANIMRARRGQAPIRGTSWMTPPSYLQSQQEYNRTTHNSRRTRRGRNEDYVPAYTQEANENDLGYYDDKGIFHVNSKAEPLSPPPPLEEGGANLAEPSPARVQEREGRTTAQRNNIQEGYMATHNQMGTSSSSSSVPPVHVEGQTTQLQEDNEHAYNNSPSSSVFNLEMTRMAPTKQVELTKRQKAETLAKEGDKEKKEASVEITKEV